jgi:hypothetical protein
MQIDLFVLVWNVEDALLSRRAAKSAKIHCRFSLESSELYSPIPAYIWLFVLSNSCI